MTAETSSATYQLFISYAEDDRPWVDGYLLDALEAAGVNYYSEDAFALGAPRVVEFERAVKQSRRTLLILSPAYLVDTFGQFVEVLASSYGLTTATWPVIPLVLQPVELPERLSQLVKLEATNPDLQQRSLARLFAELERPLPGPAPLPECPYPGMVPFTEDDSARFFGREREIQELLDQLRVHPFLTVIGASGSGKSSLVRAGLIPALRKSRSFGAGEWMMRTFRPGANPSAALTAALGDIPRAREVGAPIGTAALGDFSLASGTRLLLVVDQFEETFTLAGAEAQPFQQSLAALARIPSCYVVLTVRADFYADLMTSPLWDSIQSHRFELAPMNEAGLKAAIVRPAEGAGVAIEAALVERLQADAEGEPGVLPLIQETLRLLWERLERRFLPMRAYEALVLTRASYGSEHGGEYTGLQVAIARRADATLAGLSAVQQAIARRIFLRLIQFGEGRADTRRQQPAAALQSAGDDPALFDQTLQRLAENRLITLSGAESHELENQRTREPPDAPGLLGSSVLRFSARVDISHEALIRGWPALQGWVQERREGEQTRRRLEGKAAEWLRLERGGGLLDEVEVLEAERWLHSPDAEVMGFDQALAELVAASGAAIDAAAQAKDAARQRELAQAQALADEQTRRAEEQTAASQRLRRRAIFLAGALALAVLAAVAALLFQQQAQQQRGVADTNAAEALRQKGAADTNAAEALRQKGAADTNAAEAQKRGLQSRVNELAAQSQQAGANGFPQLSLLLASAALQLGGKADQAPAVSALRVALAQAAGRPLVGPAAQVSALAYSPDGRELALGSRSGTVRLLDMRAADPSAKPTLLRGHEGQILAVAFSPDGRYLATGGQDATARLWNLHAGAGAAEATILRGHVDAVLRLAFSPDGRYLATGSQDASALVWDLRAADPAAAPIALLGHQGAITTLAFSPDGRTLATGSQDATVRLWDLRAADPAASPTVLRGDEEQGEVTALAFSPDGRELVAGSGYNVFLISHWNLRAADLAASRQALAGHTAQITSLLFDAAGRYLFSASRDNTVRRWDLRAPDAAAPLILRGHTDEIRAMALSPDPAGRYLVTAGLDQSIRRWDLASADPNSSAIVLRGHDDNVFGLALSPDGHTLISASDDGSARRWDMEAAGASAGATILRSGQDAILSMAYSADGRYLATGSADNIARYWDLAADQPATTLRELGGSTNVVNAVAWSPTERHLLATASDGDLIQLWNLDADTTAPAKTLTGSAAGTLALAFSADGRYLAGGAQDSTVWIWDLAGSAAPQVLTGHDQPVYGVAFSPDGRYLASGSLDATIRLWDRQSRSAAPRVLAGHSDAVVALAFSPDGRYLASGSWDHTVRRWDLAAGADAPPLVLSGHRKEVTAVAFSPDGQYLASTSYDKTVRLWDLRAADPVASTTVLSGHTGTANAVTFSPDGHTLASADAGGNLRLWQMQLPAMIGLACQAAGRNLALDEWRQYFGQEPYRQTCAQLPAHPSLIDDLVKQAAAQIGAGQIAAAASAYAAAQGRDPQYAIAPGRWDALCRAGALAGQVKDVLEACGQAVALAPDSGAYHDSRGIARALIGDSTGAIDDFKLYVAWANNQPNLGAAIAERQAWIAALKSGANPIDAATLAGLRGSSQ